MRRRDGERTRAFDGAPDDDGACGDRGSCFTNASRERRFVSAAFVACVACVPGVAGIAGCSDTPAGTLTLTTGLEVDVLSRAPAPTALVVENVDLSGTATELARATLPTSELSLGERPRTDIGAVRVRALDASGATLVKGESPLVQYGALEDVDLEIFVQRTGELARLPRADARLEAPRVALAASRYVLATSGTRAILYDLLLLRTMADLPPLPRDARSLVTSGNSALVVDDRGASSVNLATGESAELAPLADLAFADVAGGATVVSPELVFIVGGTRASGGPTTRAFVLKQDGDPASAALATPREGACATWVGGRGLVVVGGSAAGAGVEVLAPGATQAAALAYPADPVRGCAATPLDSSRVLVVGGVGTASDAAASPPPRVIDLACGASCAPSTWPALPVALVRADAVAMSADAALIIGDDASGASHVVRASSTEAREIPLKVARRGARLFPLPVKGAAIVVGGAAEIEQYVE